MSIYIKDDKNIDCNIYSFKIKILKCKEILIKSEFWSFMINELESKISETWGDSEVENKYLKNKNHFNSNISMFVVGLGSLEKCQYLNSAPFFQLAFAIALNEHLNFESIYFCDPEFTFLDSDVIFEIFMDSKTHIEIFTGNDLSTPLNSLHTQSINKEFGRNKKIKLFFFMPHCDRCVFGMLIHYFTYGKGKYLYSDNSQIIVWGNNLNTFKIDSHKNYNRDCEFCDILSSTLEKANLSSIKEMNASYNTLFNYSFSDLSLYILPI